MSPTIATFRPRRSFLVSRIVKMSRSPCVGCSWLPSPALTTLQPMHCVRYSGVPADECRITTMSTPIASMFRAVSRSVSPLLTELPDDENSSTSAESRCAASVKLVRVRVESSMNRLTTTRPRSAGTFLMLRVETSLKLSAVSRTYWISSADRDSRSSKCFRVQVAIG